MTALSLSNWENTSFMGVHNPEIWDAFTRAINELKQFVWDDPRIDDDLARAEGVRYLTRLIAGAIPMTMECWDPDYPSLLKFLSSRIQYGIPAADALYQWAAVHGDHVYRIKGWRGSAHMMDVESRSGHFAHVDQWRVVDRSSELQSNADGSIEIVLSREEQPGNWIRIGEGPGDIIFRQYFYDWLNEESAQLQISRDGANYPPPAVSKARIAQHMQLLIDWLRNLPAFFAKQVQSYYQISTNTMAFDEVAIGWAELRYGKCPYQCAPDEALIIDVRPPDAEYWSFQLYSQYWDARDWHLRQTSINGHQAVLDKDGMFRAVVAHSDPGVKNWLDAAGHQTGLLSARYFRAKAINVPTITRVKLDQLRGIITEDNAYLSREARSEALQARFQSVIRRGCI